MILRTPPQRKRRADSVLDHESPVSDRRLVPYTEPVPLSCHDPSDQMACTYHCRQMVKSEFLDAFSTAEKQVIDYRSQLEVLNKDLFTSVIDVLTEEERKKFWEQLCFAEQELAASRGREQALQERLLKEVTDSQERYRMQVKRCSELEVQLKKEVDVRKKAEASAAKQKAMDLDRELICLSERSEREKSRLQKELLHLQDVEKLSHSRLNSDLERMRVRADNAAKESELLKKQMEDLREQLNECLLQKSEVEHKLSSLTVPTSEVTPKESETLVRHLQEELRKYEVEVREARKFKSSQGDLLLKEKLLEEKVHREKAEAELSKLQEVQLNADKLEHELMAWKSLVKEIPGVSSLGDIPTKFAGMQKEVLDSMTKVVEVSAHLKDLEQALELANIGRQHAETDSALAKEKAEELALEVKRLTLALELNTKERDRLRKDGVMWNKLKSGHLESGTANESLLKDLESSLAQRGSTIKELESNLREQREVIDRQHNELRLMNEKLNAEATKIKFLEREGDRLRSDISVLESKLGHGDYSAANTKVLRMVNTLAVDNEVKHTIEALRAELQKAQAKLQAVEELKGQSDAGSLIDSQISDKLAQLKGQIATLEKREERYKAVFAEKISVFRRACCSLFGYKIVMDDQQRPNGIPMTRFTLQSIYAQSDDEKLEFEYESGNTNILVNDYTSQREISQQVEIFIRKMNSIPAFTANLTVESFNKRTLS